MDGQEKVDLRRRILEALARGDGQMLDGFDLGHTAEMMYGKQADAITLLLGKEVRRFAREVARQLHHDVELVYDKPGARHERRALTAAARDVDLAGKAYDHQTQAIYNESELSKPIGVLGL